MLMRRDPYRVIEGLAIAAFAVGATQAYCATKRKYGREVSALRRAALEMSTIGLLGDLEIGPADEEVAVAVRPARPVVDPSSNGWTLEQDARDAALS